MCDLAGDASSVGQMVMQQRQRQQRGQGPAAQSAAKGWAQLKASTYAAGQLSAALLEKLLGLYRGLADGSMPSTGGSSSSSIRHGSGSSASGLKQVCHYSVTVLAGAVSAAAATAANEPERSSASTLDQQSTPRQVLPLIAQCCKVLQDYVRTLGAAELLSSAAAQAASAARPFSSSTEDLPASMLEYVAALLVDLQYQRSTSALLIPRGGPLVAPVLAADDVSSPAAVQMHGLLCTLLKVYSSSSHGGRMCRG